MANQPQPIDGVPTYWNVTFKKNEFFKEVGFACLSKTRRGGFKISIELDSLPINFNGNLVAFPKSPVHRTKQDEKSSDGEVWDTSFFQE